jgi:predicted N-acetyltransferase YhbS
MAEKEPMTAEEYFWKIEDYRPEDKADILEMNRAEYGEIALASEAYFDWLNLQNPVNGNYVRVAREKATGAVIGFSMFVPVRMIWQKETMTALVGANLVIRPEFRRRGISLEFSNSLNEDFKQTDHRFLYAFPNPRSKPGLIRNKYTVVCQIPLLVRPLNIGVLTGSYLQNAFLRWGVNIGWQAAGHIVWREHQPSQNGHLLDIMEDKGFDEAYDRFWEKVRTKYNLMIVRDRAFLQWRFIEIPYRKYTILSARRGRDILGYAVLRQAEIRKTEVGMIADLLVLPGEEGERAGLGLLHEAMRRFRQADLALCGGLMLPHTEEYGLMRRAGYLPAPARFAPQPFYLVLKNIVDEPPLSALATPHNWFISIADHDAV